MNVCEGFTGDPANLQAQVEVSDENRYPRVEITWWDAWCDDGCYNIEAIGHMPPALRKDIGYLLEETDSTLTLSAELIDVSFTGEHKARGIRVIYKPMVERVMRLGEFAGIEVQ